VIFVWNTAGLINHSLRYPNCDYDGKGLKIWSTGNQETLKKVKNLLVTMVLVTMKITSNFHASAELKTVAATSFEQSLGGELIKNLQ
jgi:hypothetical protein